MPLSFLTPCVTSNYCTKLSAWLLLLWEGMTDWSFSDLTQNMYAAIASKKLLAFDLDDTLAVTKKPISDQAAANLQDLLGTHQVAVITGGSAEQVMNNVADRLEGPYLERLHLMALNGACYYGYDTSTHQWLLTQLSPELAASDRLQVAATIEATAKQLGFWELAPAGPIIEDRGSQVTFSALGQQASPEAKYAWDPGRRKRIELRAVLTDKLPGFEVRINGNTSIDVTASGMDKGHGMQWLAKKLELQFEEMLFVGDQLDEAGNDYPIKALGIDTIAVENHHQTDTILRSVLECLDGFKEDMT